MYRLHSALLSSDLTLGTVGAPVARLTLTGLRPHTFPVGGAGRVGALGDTPGQVLAPLVTLATLQHQSLLLLLLKYQQISLSSQPSPAPCLTSVATSFLISVL